MARRVPVYGRRRASERERSTRARRGAVARRRRRGPADLRGARRPDRSRRLARSRARDLEPLTADLPLARSRSGTPDADATSARSTTSSAPARGSVPADSRFRSGSATSSSTCATRASPSPRSRSTPGRCSATIDLLVPEGVEVDVRAQSRARAGQAAGGARDRRRARRGSCSPAASVFGVVKVRHKRLWEKVGLAAESRLAAAGDRSRRRTPAARWRPGKSRTDHAHL